MHPYAMYVAITNDQREHGSGATWERPAMFARVDATPIIEPEPVSRVRRVTGLVRRLVIRTAGI